MIEDPSVSGTQSTRTITPTAPSTTVAPSGPDWNKYPGLSGLYAMFSQYGLQSLLPIIEKIAIEGQSDAEALITLRSSEPYKQRFVGMDVRLKNGYTAIDEASYLALENAYKSAAQAYNLPATFYDNPGDFAELIGNNISGNEFAQRAGQAFKYAQASDPAAKAMLMEYYGINDSQITAYFLDPKKAQAVLDRQAASIDIGVEAARQGLMESRARAESFADQGISAKQAAAGYGEAALMKAEGQLDIAKRFGEDLTANDLVDETVGGLASARRKRERVNEMETNLFRQGEGSAQRAFAPESLGSY